MAENFRRNPTALRAFVFYEFKAEKPIFEAYKNFCHSMGKETMDYIEFEFWFMRFANGNFDLNYDRSLDPKTHSLSDMPLNIFEKIVNKLDFIDRFVIRKVSRNFRFNIDSWNPGFKKIRVDIYSHNANLYFDDELVIYRKPSWGENDLQREDCVVEYGKRKTVIKTKRCQELAIDDLAIVLKNPTLQLDEFHVEYYIDKHFEELEPMLKSLNRKLHVKKVKTNNYGDPKLLVLLYLETGTLKEIELDINESISYKLNKDNMKSMMDGIVNLEQCKNAEMLKLKTHAPPDTFPIESLLQLRRFIVHFENRYNNRISKQTVLQFIKTLLKSTVLEVAVLKTSNKFPLDLKQLGPDAIEVPGRPNIRRLRIPNSNEFFEIEANEDSIRIERIS